MSTHLLGFHPFFLHNLVFAELATSSIRVNSVCVVFVSGQCC